MPGRSRHLKLAAKRPWYQAWRQVPMSVRFAAVLITGGAVFCGLLHAARVRAMSDPALVFETGRIELGDLPWYLDAQTVALLENPGPEVLPPRIHMLDRTPLALLDAYYRGIDWVDAVIALEYRMAAPHGLGAIVGRLKLKEPLCVVAYRPAEFYFADDKGARIGGPIVWPPPPAAVREAGAGGGLAIKRLPVVSRAAVLPARGERWRGAGPQGHLNEALLHGFYLAARFREEGLVDRGLAHWVAEIRVQNVGKDYLSEIELVTEPGHGLRIQWGRTRRSEVVDGRMQAASDGKKITVLRDILRGVYDGAVSPHGEILLYEWAHRQNAGT